MEATEKTKIDPSKITGPYPLLGLFLLVVEGLLGFWMFRAEDISERIVAGGLMTLILFAFLFAFLRMFKDEKGEAIRPQGLTGDVTPAKEEATEVEIENPQPEMIAAPDRSYLIARPPQDWKIRELSFSDWVGENLGISDPATKNAVAGRFTNKVEDNILVFSSSSTIKIIPTPGQSLFDGRKLPTALTSDIPVRLAILPIDRAQPPLYIDRPLESNFLQVLGGVSALGIVTLRRLHFGIMKGSGRRYMMAELRQEMDDVEVDGRSHAKINGNSTLIGIEGELRDHLLIMNYPSTSDNDTEIDQNLEILQNLVSSFRPLKTTNPDEERRKIKKLADQKFHDLMLDKGEDLFYAEFSILILRLKGKDMSNPNERHEAIKMLAPFEVFAKEIELQDERFSQFWDAMHKAEEGDATDFKKQLVEVSQRYA